MSTTTYSVKGMTCGHCVKTVKGAIADLPGVTEVDVDLPSGHVTVDSEGEIDIDDLKAAVAEVGYEVVA
jgi:copper chaperone